MKEKNLHQQICNYIRLQYPTVLFNSDLAGSTKLTFGQAVAMKRLRSRRGFPDLVIYEQRNGFGALFIELKKEGTDLLKKRLVDAYGYPCWASDHIKEQNEMIEALRERNYKAEFAIGFLEAQKLIDEYLK